MKNTVSGKSKNLFFSLAAVTIVMTALLLCYFKFRPQAAEGRKTITVDVVYGDGTMENFMIDTDEEYLEKAFEEAEGLTVEGSRTIQFGLMIETVNGVKAIYDKDQAYWSVELEGQPCNYGVSQQPIRDKEYYRLVYTAAKMP